MNLFLSRHTAKRLKRETDSTGGSPETREKPQSQRKKNPTKHDNPTTTLPSSLISSSPIGSRVIRKIGRSPAPKWCRCQDLPPGKGEYIYNLYDILTLRPESVKRRGDRGDKRRFTGYEGRAPHPIFLLKHFVASVWGGRRTGGKERGKVKRKESEHRIGGKVPAAVRHRPSAAHPLNWL